MIQSNVKTFHPMSNPRPNNNQFQYNVIHIMRVFIIWLVLFEPPILGGISLRPLLAYFSIIYIIINRNLCSNIIIVELNLGLLALYSLIISLINRESLGVAYSFGVVIVEILPICWAISLHFFKHCVPIIGILNTLIYSALLEALFVYAAVLSEPIHNTFIQLMAQSTGNIDYYHSWDFRTYGLASNLQFSTPIVMSVAALLSFVLWIQDKKTRYLVFILILLPAAYLNARTSLLLFIVGCLGLLFTQINNIKTILRMVLFILILLLIMILYVNLASYSEQIRWLKDGIYDILSIFGFENQSTYSTLAYFTSSNQYRLPNEAVSLLFGTARTVMVNGVDGYYTDVGFLNDLWFGGVVYCVVLYGLSVVALHSVFSCCKKCGMDLPLLKSIYTIIIACITITNIKGLFFSINSALVTVLLLSLCMFQICKKAV